MTARLRAGQKFGKYRIRRRLARGGFGDVYEAHDTIEGVGIALKVPLGAMDPETLEDFRREARLASRLEHPNVLPIKNADFVDGTFVIAYPLGDESLEDRMTRRLSLRSILDLAEQMLAALAHAHENSIIHCDVKPGNLILFDDERLRLTDFGIARVAARRTMEVSASGSVGYMAPEQALGKPTKRSDVFSAGLVLYRLLTGALPSWPFEWPPPGYQRLRRHGPHLSEVLRRALQVDTRKRYRDASQMLAAFRKAKPKVLRRAAGKRNGQRRGSETERRGWREIKLQQFRQRFGKSLRLDHSCAHCRQAVDERMQACPWCAAAPMETVGESSFPAACPRCGRGIKLDWIYCPWCYGGKIGPQSPRQYSDRRYSAKCRSPKCTRKLQLPFMRYCPWCRVKVHRRWPLPGSKDACSSCGQRVARGFWSSCAWCGTELGED